MTQAAVVGLGTMGLFHSCILQAIPSVELAAVVEPDDARLATARSLGLKAHAYPSIGDLLDDGKVTAVLLCTPTHFHEEQLKLILSFGIDVFCEKRVTLSAEVTRRLADLAERNGRIAAGGYMLAYSPTFQMMRQLLRKGEIGELLSFEAVVFHSELFKRKKGWQFVRHRSGGGVVSGPGAHVIYLLDELFGMPSQVHARLWQIHSEVEDVALVSLTYSSGLAGKLLASWTVPGRPVFHAELMVCGTEGSIRWSRQSLSLKRRDKSQTWTTLELESPGVVNLALDSNGDSYFLEIQDFITCCENRRDPITNFRRCAEAEAMLDAIYASPKSDRREELKGCNTYYS